VQIKRSVPVTQWNQAKEYVKGSGRMVEELNNYISSIRVRLYQIHWELEESGKNITADRIKDIHNGNDESKKTLLQLFEEHNNQCRQLIGKDFVAKTVQRYETTAKYVKEFLEKKHKISWKMLQKCLDTPIQR
ncbi:MAG: hypothetical protein PHF73_11685, partial [Massilibacteroides sp.]|nr:hypothetical protein [Massilibacteroides sp.]MDD4661305.1 hypothetical protein [Massilibacteroides sp.]